MFDFTIGESKAKQPPIPDGSYVARFVGTELSPAKEWEGKMLEEGIRWQFEVANGAQAGRKVGRITGKHPTPENACGKMIGSLLGKPLTPNESVSLQGCVGRTYWLNVQGGKAETVSIPPQQ